MLQSVVIASVIEVELAPAPIPPDWILSGTPQAHSRQLARSHDRASSVIAWSCTAGRFKWHYTVDETAHIVAGEVFVTDENGGEHRLGPGDTAFFPAGSRSTWHVPAAVRKVAVCRQAMPRPFAFALRAWNRLAHIMVAVFWPPEGTASDPLAPRASADARNAGGVRNEA